MAKSYSATLQLKDANMVSTLKKASQAAKDLQKSLTQISKTPVKIEAKLGSSFKNVENNISKITPKTKTIRIEATETVTKTMNNVQRSMFEMSNKMNSTINSTMKGFSTSLSASLPKIQAIGNTMAAIANTSRLASNIARASAASSLAGAGAGVAGIAALSRRNNNNNDDDIVNAPTGFLAKLKASASKVASTGISLGKRFSKGFKDAIENAVVKYKSGVIGNFINTKFSSSGIFASAGSGLAEMIEKQKTKLESLGMSNPLKNWKEQFITTGPEDEEFLGFKRNWQSATAQALAQSKQVFKEMGQNAKENLGAAANWVKNKWNSNIFAQAFQGGKAVFKELKENAISNLTPITNKIKQMAYSFKYACDRGVYFFTYFATKGVKSIVQVASAIKTKITNAFNTVKSTATNVMSKIASHIPQPIQKAFSKIKEYGSKAFSKISNVAKNAASKFASAFKSAAGAAGSAIVSGLSSAFNKVKSIASGVAKAIGAAFAGALAFGVKDMATQEQYITSMTHFISVDDAKANGTNTITMDQAKDRATGLFDWGTEFANSTPFQNADVYSAINRMTQVFGYGEDGSEVKKMVKLVGDMAALNPGKTMGDAAEAIADLALGETERMKEFGFKISQDELKALAGVPGQSDSLTQDQIMTAFSKLTSSGGALFETFDGGAEALSQTLSGKFSTVMGKFRQMMVDAVSPFKDILKGSLDKAIGFIDGEFKTKFVNAFSTVASFVSDLIAGDSSNFPIIENLINAFSTLKESVMPVIDTIKEQFDSIFDSASDSFGGIGGIIEGAANFIADIITGLTPILELLTPVFNFIKETAIAVWPVIQGVIDVASQVIQDAVGFITPVIDACTQVMQTIGDSVAEIWPGIQETIMNVWDKLQPVFELFGDLAQLIADIFAVAWPPIAGVLETLWSIVGPILESMADALAWVADLCSKVVDGISGAVNAVKNSKLNPANWFGGGEDGSHADGLDRVPKDGYKAILHEGERVLTARQARELDRGTAQTSSNNITVNVNGAKDARAVAEEVVREIKAVIPNLA